MVRYGSAGQGFSDNTLRGTARHAKARQGAAGPGQAWQGMDFETTQGSATSGGAGRGEARQGRDLIQHMARLAAVGHGLVRLVAAGHCKAGIFRQQQTTAAQHQVR